MTAAFSGTRIERNTSIRSTNAPSTTAPITSGRYFSTRWVRSIKVAVAPPTWASRSVPSVARSRSLRSRSTSAVVAVASGPVDGVTW